MWSLPVHAKWIGQGMSARPSGGSVGAALLGARAFYRFSYDSRTSTVRSFSRARLRLVRSSSPARSSRLVSSLIAFSLAFRASCPDRFRIRSSCSAACFFLRRHILQSQCTSEEKNPYSTPHPHMYSLCVDVILHDLRIDIQLVVHPLHPAPSPLLQNVRARVEQCLHGVELLIVPQCTLRRRHYPSPQKFGHHCG